MSLHTVPRYDGYKGEPLGEHAVVVGASVAGLLAARILTDWFETVTVIDRDPLPDEPIARRGVPQSKQIHALLTAASSTLEDLFPGFGEALMTAGGLVLDSSSELRFFLGGGFFAPSPTRLPFYSASRPLIEQIVRRRVFELDAIRLRSDTRFTDYLVDDDRTAVEGVSVRAGTADGAEELAADVVVDATSRTSRTPKWLRAHGYGSPSTDEVTIDMAYSTAQIERLPSQRRAYIVPPDPPNPRGGTLLPVEGDRWLLSLHGFHGDHPPTDPEGFGAYAASLPVPELAQLFDEYPMVTDEIHHYPYPSNRRYRYESLDEFPEGLIVVGDAVASFNPIYAQGMSVAALEALALHQVLAEDGIEQLGRRFFSRVEAVVDSAWGRAVDSDFQFPQTTGPKPRGTDFRNWYSARLIRRAHADGTLSEALTRVTMMEESPTSLFRPDVLWRAFKPT